MKSLAALQSEFQRSAQSGELSKTVTELIHRAPTHSKEHRISIYHHAYLIRMTESVKDDFVALEQSLGEEQFEALVMEFVRRQPSSYRNLAEYSEGFPQFLRERRPELFDLAQREWMKIVTLQSALPPDALTLSEVQSGKPFVLMSHPSVYIASSGAGQSAKVSFFNRDQVRYLELSEAHAAFLSFFSVSRSAGDVEAWIESSGADGIAFADTLQSWIQQGVIYCKGVDL